jgi:hypothetical protein
MRRYCLGVKGHDIPGQDMADAVALLQHARMSPSVMMPAICHLSPVTAVRQARPVISRSPLLPAARLYLRASISVQSRLPSGTAFCPGCRRVQLGKIFNVEALSVPSGKRQWHRPSPAGPWWRWWAPGYWDSFCSTVVSKKIGFLPGTKPVLPVMAPGSCQSS